MSSKKIRTALISVYNKDGLAPIIQRLTGDQVEIYSTGGTQKFIEDCGASVTPVEELTGYPSILGGRVKTLHPKVFGGILSRGNHQQDQQELNVYEIPTMDLVIVDLYPFEETLASRASEQEIIEKIDIGGISLIRAAAKNYQDVLVVASRDQYPSLLDLLIDKNGSSEIDDRLNFATHAFAVSSHYDIQIFNFYACKSDIKGFKQSYFPGTVLRYGENPHQQGVFYGKLEDMFEQLHGRSLSYNNLVDIDAAVNLIDEFDSDTAFAILKHTNACGVAIGQTVKEAYQKAFAADTISAFGGVLITNKMVDVGAAQELNKLFFEVLVAPNYQEEALEILKGKKKRILLRQKGRMKGKKQFKSLLNGVIEQDRDSKTDEESDLKIVTSKGPTKDQKQAMLFASKIAKHTKSNTIVLAKQDQMIANGVGQTSRVDALKQSIEKAKAFGFDLNEVIMASDAFFPFPDCVEIASKEGIKAVIQPGGSIRDQESIDFCNKHGMAMATTGFRHFKH